MSKIKSEEMIKMAFAVLNDVELQNMILENHKLPDDFLTPELKARRRMEYSDTLPGAVGRFGYDVTNPILVNESLGEESYLPRLTYDGQRVAFFRLGSVAGCMDKFVVVPMDCSRIDVLYLDMYHAFQSKIAPEGYKLENIVSGSTGTSECPESFDSFVSTVCDSATSHFGAPIVDKCLKDFDTKKANKLLEKLREQ